MSLSLSSLRRLFPRYELPFISKKEWGILKKISTFRKIKKIPGLRNKRGEIDLTLNKAFITSKNTGYPLIRGVDIQEGRILTQRKESINLSDFLKNKSAHFTKRDFEKIRIVGQQIVNIDADKRLIFALSEKNFILGNSCNYLTVASPLEIDWILIQLDSYLLNWRFKMTSTNNHVNNYEIDELPIVENTPKNLRKCNDTLSQNVLVCKQFGLDMNETKLILKKYFEEIEISSAFKKVVA